MQSAQSTLALLTLGLVALASGCRNTPAEAPAPHVGRSKPVGVNEANSKAVPAGLQPTKHSGVNG